jgi:hypothetical protein
MAKRYYNLEKETKDYLKACSDRNITPRVSNKEVNDYVIKQKNNQWTPTASQLIEYALSPVLWLDSSVSFSYRGAGTVWANLMNNTLNASLPASALFKSLKRSGAVFLPLGAVGTTPWTTLGLTNIFTLDFWITVSEITGVNSNGLIHRELYLTNGFRCGINNPSKRINFASGQSGGNVNINSGLNSIILGTPVNITITYNPTTLVASIYKNGVLVQTQTNATLLAPSTTVSTQINASLDSTSSSLQFHNLKIYNKALTQTEITESYNTLSSRFFS